MDWDVALRRHTEALLGFVSWMLSRLGPAAAGPVSRTAHLAVLRVLRAAESVLRRLIVIAARDLTVAVPASRPMPAGLCFSGAGAERIAAFSLFDPRKVFDRSRKTPKGPPRISIIGDGEAEPRQGQDSARSELNIDRLRARLTALQNALDGLPEQALRLARLKVRRALQRIAGKKVTALGPLRPGSPPGYRMERRKPVHDLLRECDHLARLAENARVVP